MSGHVDDEAAGIAALDESDPERRAAYAHAASCARCALALEESDRLIAMLDGAALPPPGTAAMRRTWAVVAAQLGKAGETAESGAPGRRARAGGRTGRLAAALAFGASVALASFDATASGVSWKIGLECLVIELAVASAALLGMVRLAARRGMTPSGAACAAVAAWAAFSAQGYLHFRCPVGHEEAHLVVFHLGGVMLATVLAGRVVRGRVPQVV